MDSDTSYAAADDDDQVLDDQVLAELNFYPTYMVEERDRVGPGWKNNRTFRQIWPWGGAYDARTGKPYGKSLLPKEQWPEAGPKRLPHNAGIDLIDLPVVAFDTGGSRDYYQMDKEGEDYWVLAGGVLTIKNPAGKEGPRASNPDYRRPREGPARPPVRYLKWDKPDPASAWWRGMVDTKDPYPAATFGLRIKTYGELWPDFKARADAVRDLSAYDLPIKAAAVQWRMAAVSDVLTAIFHALKFYVSDLSNAGTLIDQAYWGVAPTTLTNAAGGQGKGPFPLRYYMLTKFDATGKGGDNGGLLGYGGTLASKIGGAFGVKPTQGNTSPVLTVMRALQKAEDDVYVHVLKLPGWSTIKQQILEFDEEAWPVTGRRGGGSAARSYDLAPKDSLAVRLATDTTFDAYLAALLAVEKELEIRPTEQTGRPLAYESALLYAKAQLNGRNPATEEQTAAQEAERSERVDREARLLLEGDGGIDHFDPERIISWPLPEDMTPRAGGLPTGSNPLANIGGGITARTLRERDKVVVREHFRLLKGAPELGTTPLMKREVMRFFEEVPERVESSTFEDITDPRREEIIASVVKPFWRLIFADEDHRARARAATVPDHCDELTEVARLQKLQVKILRYHQLCLKLRFAKASPAGSSSEPMGPEVALLKTQIGWLKETAVIERFRRELAHVYDFELLRKTVHANLVRVYNVAVETGNKVGEAMTSTEAAQSAILTTLTNEVAAEASRRRKRCEVVAKWHVWENGDDVAMRKVYQASLQDLEKQLRAWARKLTDGATPQDDYPNLKAVGDDAFLALALLINQHDHVVEMLGPRTPDWSELLRNLSVQIRTHNTRAELAGIDTETQGMAFGAERMDFQVFPDCAEGQNLTPRLSDRDVSRGEGCLVDETVVLRDALRDARVLEDIAFIAEQSTGDGRREARARELALHARGLMKLLEKGYRPDAHQEATQAAKDAFARFWGSCGDGTFKAVGRKLAASNERNASAERGNWGVLGTPDRMRPPSHRVWLMQRWESIRSRTRSYTGSERTVGPELPDRAKSSTHRAFAPAVRNPGASTQQRARDLRESDETKQSNAFEWIAQQHWAAAAYSLPGGEAVDAEQLRRAKLVVQVNVDAKEQQIRMLGKRLSDLLDQGEKTNGLFRKDRAVVDQYGTLTSAGVNTPFEPLMTGPEALIAFQLVELLVTIKTSTRDVFDVLRGGSIADRHPGDLAATLRRGVVLLSFPENFARDRRASDASSGDGVATVMAHLEGSWNLSTLSREYAELYDALLKIVYTATWQLRSKGYLDYRNLFYPVLGSTEETRMLGFEATRERRAAEAQKGSKEVALPYIALAHRLAYTEQSRMRRSMVFLETLTEIYKRGTLEKAGPGATVKHCIEQIEEYLLINNAMISSRVEGMYLSPELLRIAELEVEAADRSEVEVRALAQALDGAGHLEYGLPSEQVHPISYEFFLMLTEIKHDLQSQLQQIKTAYSVWSALSAERQAATPTVEVTACRWLDQDTENPQEFYVAFGRHAIRASARGGSSKAGVMRQDAGQADRVEAIVQEYVAARPAASSAPSSASLRQAARLGFDDLDSPPSACDLVRWRNLDFTSRVPIDLTRSQRFVVDALYARYSMDMQSIQHAIFFAEEENEVRNVFPDMQQLSMAPEEERASWAVNRLSKGSRVGGGKRTHHSPQVLYKLPRAPYKLADDDADALPERTLEPTKPLGDAVAEVDGGAPATPQARNPHLKYYEYDWDDPAVAFLSEPRLLVPQGESGGAFKANYAEIRAPMVWPPLGPIEVETQARADMRLAYEIGRGSTPRRLRDDILGQLQNDASEQGKQDEEEAAELGQLRRDAMDTVAQAQGAAVVVAGSALVKGDEDEKQKRKRGVQEESRRRLRGGGACSSTKPFGTAGGSGDEAERSDCASRSSDDEDDGEAVDKRDSASEDEEMDARDDGGEEMDASDDGRPGPSQAGPSTQADDEEMDSSDEVGRRSRRRRAVLMSSSDSDSDSSEGVGQRSRRRGGRPAGPISRSESDSYVPVRASAAPRMPFELLGLSGVAYDSRLGRWIGPPGSYRGANGVWLMAAKTREKHSRR